MSQSKIEADPLIVALFGLPAGLYYSVHEEENNGSFSVNEHSTTSEESNHIDNRSLAMALVQQKIANIHTTIETYENDINIIRRKLALAHQELESATKELEALQQPKHHEAND